MTSRTLALASLALLTGLVLLAPAAAAHPGEAGPSTNHPCAGAVDFLCWHTDCTDTFCVRLFCIVYLDHHGHPSGVPGCVPS